MNTQVMTTKTKSQIAADDLKALFQARSGLIVIKTTEEARVEGYIFEAAAAANYVAMCWDAAQGVTDINGTSVRIGGQTAEETLNAIRDRSTNTSGKDRGVWIMRDLLPWLQGPIGMNALRSVRNLARSLPATPRDRAQSIVILSTGGDLPPELANHAVVLDWPLPDRGEIADLLDRLIEDYDLGAKLKNGVREAAIDASVGLSGEEAQASFARSLVQLKTIDPTLIAKEKKRIIAREKILEWYDPIPAGLDAVGGLDNLKAWLVNRSCAYTPAAREYVLPRPKGTFLIGISGCGKSLCAKSIATAWKCPLIRVDLGALKSKYVGESEANLRKAFAIIEAIGFCVVWFDEVEKAMQGATSGSADGGVSADAMGAVLTWMQERKSDAFIIMTANDVTQLPPEFMRKGRFDELWWIDLPNAVEREQVLKAALREHGRGDVKIDLAEVSEATKNFTGSEIAAIVPDALFAAFGDNAREINTDDLLLAARAVTPLSKTASEKIDDMRRKAVGRFRFASKTAEVEPLRKSARTLDIA